MPVDCFACALLQAERTTSAAGSQGRKEEAASQKCMRHASTVMTPAIAAEVKYLAPVQSAKSAKACIGAWPQSSREAAVPEVTKGDVRQRLALVSGYYPSARPTRGSLKQVYNFFQQAKLLSGGQ